MMELKKKYSWASLNNGKYAIFDVEILRTFSDPKRGNLDIVKMQDLVLGLKKQEAAGQWAPVFFGHHTGYENHVGAGFLDNFRIVGDVLFCDIVNIPKESFETIKRGEYPYRSVEYDSRINRVTGLALCGSQISYFVFPMFFLDEEEGKKGINMFSLNSVSEKIDKFCGCGGQKMEENSMVEKNENENEKDKEILPTSETAKMKCSLEQEGGKLDQILQAIDRLAGGIEKLLQMESEEAQEDSEDYGGDLAQEDDAESKNSSASSVAYQLRQFEKRMDAKINKLEGISKFSAQEKELQSICDDNRLDFSLHSETLKKFSSDKDRLVFMDALRNINRFSGHRMGRSLGNMGIESTTGKEKEILKKYDNLGAQDKKIVQKAYMAYQDTVSMPDQRQAQKFSALWTPERWIDNCLEQTRNNPNYIEEMTRF